MAVKHSESQIQVLLIQLFGPLSIESARCTLFHKENNDLSYRGRETCPIMVRKSPLGKGTEASN